MTTPSPRPDDTVHPERGEGVVVTGVTTPRDPAALGHPADPETVLSTAAPQGTITLDDGVLVLTGDIDTPLCRAWEAHRPDLHDVHAVDARLVTFLGSPGLALLAELAQARSALLPLWAGDRAVLRPLRVTGLDQLFDLHDPSA